MYSTVRGVMKIRKYMYSISGLGNSICMYDVPSSVKQMLQSVLTGNIGF